MAWFRRNRDDAADRSDDAPGSAAPVAPEPGPAATPLDQPAAPAPAAPETPAWASAAPLPSVIPTIQRVLANVDAKGGTALGHPAPLSLAPLGHAVTADAPAGVVHGTAVATEPEHQAPAMADGPPLEYVQRAPEGSAPARPAPPAQLLVPSYQPTGLPSLPVAAPEVQRAPAPPSLTTAPPPPQPPLVLPVGEILPPPGPAPPPAAAAEPAGDAPLLAGPSPAEQPAADLPAVPAADLPLAPVQRHADHPRHVDGDEAPGGADVQRAAADAPAPAAPLPDAPLTSAPERAPAAASSATEAPEADMAPAPRDDLPLAPAAPAVQREATASPAPPAAAPLSSASPLSRPPAPLAPVAVPPADVQRAPATELPLAPVQRHADHPGHIDGDDEPTPGADVQRAATDAPAAAPLADAPLSSAAPLETSLTPPEAATPPPAPDVQRAPATELPLAPVQRHADHPGHVDGDDEPTPGADVQRAATDASPATAPLVGGSAPLAAPPAAPAPASPPAPAPAPDMPLPGAAVQRSAAPRRPRGLGAPIGAVPTGGVEPGVVPGATSAPGEETSVAPLVGGTPAAAPPLPLAAVQRAAAADDRPAADDAGDAMATPALDLVQRAAVDAVAPLVGSAPLGSASPGAGAAAEGGAEQAAPPPSPDLALAQRAPLAATGTSAGSAASSTTSASTPARAGAPEPPLVVAPLLGGRPFSTQVQRAVDGAGSAPAGQVDRTGPEALSPEPGLSYQPLASIGMWNGAPPPNLSGPSIEAPPSHVAAAVQRAIGTDVSNVRIRRDTGHVAQRLAARAFTHDGEVHIPDTVGSLSSGEGASLATHELVHAGQQSVLGSARPHEHTPEGQALEAQARSAEHASLAGLELPKLPLAPAAPAVQRAPVETASPSPFSPLQLSRLLDLADNPPMPGIDVQRLIGSHRGSQPEAPAPPTEVAEASPEAPPEAPPAKEQTPQELEELASKLFPSLRNLLRSELLSFRRRSGTSSDRPLI